MSNTSRSAVKSHLVASIQKVGRIRGELLNVRDPRWTTTVLGLQHHLVDEARWLRAIAAEIAPDDPRHTFLTRYAKSIVALENRLSRAIAARPVDVALFQPVGTEILGLMALELEARSL